MIRLSEKYRKNSYEFELVKRVDDVAIYRQIDPETGKRVAFEIFEVMQKGAWELNGKAYDPKETTPSNEQWGIYGFTVSNIAKAEEKMGILLERIKNRHIKNSIVNSVQ